MPRAHLGQPPANSRIVLGFDYGELRIGVALGQTFTQTARPLVILKNPKRNHPDWRTITAQIEKWQPQLLIVGLPMQDDGVPYAQITEAACDFAAQLHTQTGLPVQLVDERLSSMEARSQSERSQTDAIDDIAAALIVETYLRETPHGG